MAYLDEELTPGQRHEFERHLAICPSCVNYLNSYTATVQLGKAALQSPMSQAETPNGSVPEELIRAIRAARLRGE
jgi:anti-sigma factor RsiW